MSENGYPQEEPEAPVMSDVPHDRLTNLANDMLALLDAPENADVKGYVLLDDGHAGGIAAHGYVDAQEAFIDLFTHLRAMAKANGMTLDFVAVPESPEDL